MRKAEREGIVVAKVLPAGLNTLSQQVVDTVQKKVL